MKRIGIMGGTFDPPHIGHLAMAKTVYREMKLDAVWFLPTGGITYKENAGLSSPKERLAMARLAVAGYPEFCVEPLEAESGRDSYTFETLEYLAAKHPDTEFVFIVGADSLDYMERWREPARIFQNCSVAAVNRTGISAEQCRKKQIMLQEKFGAKIRLITMPPVDVSSTWLRKMVAKGEKIDGFVPDDVNAYIQEHGLYRNPENL